MLKNHIFKTIILCFIFVGCSSGSPQPQPQPQQPPPLQNEMLDTLNEIRQQSRNCGEDFFPAAEPLRWETKLVKAAKKHSQDMADRNYFNHTSPDGSRPQDRIFNEGYKWKYGGENIAAGRDSYLKTLERWLKSPKHCRNIMDPNFKDFGAGYGYNEGSKFKHYWTQNFGTLKN